MKDSAVAIGGSVLLGGVLGAGAARLLTAAEWKQAGQVLKRALDDPEFDAGTDALHRDMLVMGSPASAGAAAVKRDTLDDLSIADPVASKAAQATARLNPAMRLLHSPSVAARDVASQLFENSAYLKKHLEGRGDPSVESLVRLSDGQVAQALDATNTAFRKARREGLLMLQFKSFMLSSNQRILIRQLGRDRGRFVSGLVALTAMGMMVEYLKQVEHNWRTPDKIPTNPGYWVASGLDRSGVFSVLFELNNMWGKMTPAPDIYTGLQSPFGESGGKSGRYAVRSPVDAMAGPSAGLLTDTARLLGLGINAGIGNGDVKEGDINAARRMTPFASLPYVRWMIDGLLVPDLKEEVSK